MASNWKVSCKASIGRWSIDSASDVRTELVALETASSLLSAADTCEVTLYAPPPKQKDQLEEAVGAAAGAAAEAAVPPGGARPAFSVQVRGNPVKHGDQLTVELKVGDRSGTVATVEVHSVESSLGETRIEGATGKRRLANTRLNQVYENQSLSQIVQDLAGQADVATGTVDSGGTYDYVVVHESKNVLAHICELAQREGMDVYFDVDNKLNVAAFSKTKPDHSFTYGIDVLALAAEHREPLAEHVMVYGESPASKRGSSTWYWLAKDLGPFRGDLGSGSRLRLIADRAIRNKDAADSQAKAKLGALRDWASTGRITVLGNPQVRVAEAIEIKSAAKQELNGLFKVAWVAHRYSKHQGYVTHIGFTGQGGVKEAGGMLGQSLGEVSGVVGS